MIHGVTDKSTLASLGLGKRLIARLGALLARKLAFSEAVLESADKGSPLAKLLTSARLLESAGELDSELLAELAAEAGVDDKLAVVATPPGKVVALEEEVEAEGAWTQPSGDGETALARLVHAPALAPGVGAGDAARAEIFTPTEVEKLKLTALTSARADEAIGAMRQLAYAPISAAERGDVFVRALAGLDPKVRAEAARLLAGVGLAPDVSEALVSLATGEEAEKRLAIDRLGKALSQLSTAGGEPDLVLVASLVALTSTLGAEGQTSVRGHVLSSLARAATVLARFPERLAEVIRHVIELLVADFPATVGGALELFEGLAAAPDQLPKLLRIELERTSDPQVRTFLLARLAALARQLPESVGVEEVADVVAAEFAGGAQTAADRQALGGEIFGLPAEAAARAILTHFGEGSLPAKRYFLRLLADLCRYRQVPDAIVEEAGEVFLGCLQGPAKELRLGVLETLMPADPRLSADLRSRLAEAYVESFSDLVFRPDIELAETTLARMGLPALPALLERLEPSWPAPERARACRVIGEMGRMTAAGKISAPKLRDELHETARKLLRTSAAEFPDPGELALALGKLTVAIAEDRAALETVWHRVSSMKMAEASRLEALSWVACGPAATAEMVEEAAKGLLKMLTAPEPDSLGTVTEVRSGTERMLELSAEASDFVTAMPAVVRGLTRAAQSPAAGPPLRSRVLTALINRWKDLVSAKRIWGPAAATTVIDGLRDLACLPSARPAEKLEVIKALGLRLADPPAMHAISEILAVDDDSQELSGPAASAALALLDLRDPRGRFPEEDREHVLRALARILGRRAVNTSTRRTAKLRERILEELCDGLNDNVPGVFDALTRVAESEGLAPEMLEEVKSRLAARTALAPRAKRRQS
jgi:hypothetical protein